MKSFSNFLLKAILVLIFSVMAFETDEALAASTSPQTPTDWNLYMMRLVNRARVDPAGENLIQGTSYNESSTHPLAYSPLVGRAAQNHNEWMGINDEFSHYENSGTGFTGENPGNRLNHVGYSWSSWGENVLYRGPSSTADISDMDLSELQDLLDQIEDQIAEVSSNKSEIESDHALWWNSDGHRNNLMNPSFTAFGHHAGNLGGKYWATQDFATPGTGPETYILGLVFEDKNGNNSWDPFNVGSSQRESLGNVSYEVFLADTNTVVGAGETFDNGAYSFPIGNGSYDIGFNVPEAGTFLVEDILVNGANVNAGDLIVPEPATLALFALGGLSIIVRRGR